MTDYQLKVLREIDGRMTEETVSRMLHGGYANGTTYSACRTLFRAGLVRQCGALNARWIWKRTPAGDAALADAEKRLLPREEAKLF